MSVELLKPTRVNYEVIDGALPKEALLELQQLMIPKSTQEFPWYGVSPIAYADDAPDEGFYLTHNFFINNGASNWYGVIEPILEVLKAKALIRAKGNMYLPTAKRETHNQHVDYDFSHKGAIFSVNTNDGATVLSDGTEIESKENRLLLFDPSELHSSTSCTNAMCRVNINFNYF